MVPPNSENLKLVCVSIVYQGNYEMSDHAEI